MFYIKQVVVVGYNLKYDITLDRITQLNIYPFLSPKFEAQTRDVISYQLFNLLF